MKSNSRIWLLKAEHLEEGSYRAVDVIYAGEPSSILVFRHQGKCFAYRNRCVHMSQRLDCQADTIFDDTGQHLRCSMHGVIYDPVTGEALTAISKGDKLTAIKIEEDDDGLWLCDKRVKPVA